MDLRLTALRCPFCQTLFEIPKLEVQEREIQEKYAEIVDKLKFPCPSCGRYFGFSGPIFLNDLK